MWPYVRLLSRRQCTTAAGNPKHSSSNFLCKHLDCCSRLRVSVRRFPVRETANKRGRCFSAEHRPSEPKTPYGPNSLERSLYPHDTPC
jgi:hypothetical protein